MAICINKDGICFGSYSITPSTDGICISGVFSHQGTELNPTPQQGTTNGYLSAGSFPSDTPSSKSETYRFPFASDTNATCVGDITVARRFTTGISSTDSGYVMGGGPPPGDVCNIIDRFPFASESTCVDVGDMTLARRNLSSQGSPVSGYITGGGSPIGPSPPFNGFDTIEKFPFAADSNASDVGELTSSVFRNVGHSTFNTGFSAGGDAPNFASVTRIESFPFSADAPATCVGDITCARGFASAQASKTHGYISGGRNNATGIRDVMDKYQFADATVSTDVGELAAGTICDPTGTSSITTGYVIGGFGPGAALCNIETFPFAADVNSSCVASLTAARYGAAGNQD